MRKLLFFVILFCGFIQSPVRAQLFSEVSPSGHTLYYQVIDSVNHYVMVTCPNINLTYDYFDVWWQPCSDLWGNNAFPTGGLVLPETVTNGETTYTVKAISDFAFLKCPITSIVMPNTIDSIGNYAFFKCSYLSNVTFSNSLRYIGELAFFECYLGNLVLPPALKILKSYAFANAHISRITLNDSLEVLEPLSLSENQFDSLYIPASVREIASPCRYMSCLSKIVVDPANPYYDSRNNCNAIITAMGEVVQACSGTILPEGVTVLVGDAFRGYSYETFVVPSTVLNMNFYECHIGTLVLSSPQFTLDFLGNSIDTIKVMTDTPPLFMSSLIGDFDYNVRYQTPIVVTCNALPAFQTADVWRDFTNYIGIFPYSAIAQDNEHGYVQVEQPSCANHTARYTACPKAGYHFVQWNDGDYSNPRVVGVTCDTSLSATFALTDTLRVALIEGEQYNGHIQAGVWLDTIAGYVPDSVVLSIVDITVDRPIDSSAVMLGSNISGAWNIGDDVVMGSEVALQVPPDESRQVVFHVGETAYELVVNGDFEHSNIESFITDYATPDSPGSPYRIYSHQGGTGVDGSNCIYYDGSEIADQAIIAVSKPTVTGCYYRFSYMARNTGGDNPPYFQVKVNGVPLQGTDIVPQDGGIWTTFIHDFVATAPFSTIEIVDLCLQGGGNDFYLDNVSLVQTTSNFSYTINVTNTHGLVYDTVDVTIAEGEIYHGHTLAGVYQDTIIGTETDSIVYARVSMEINHSIGAGIATLTTNQDGRVWIGLDDDAIGIQPTINVTVDPTDEHRYVLTSLDNNSNLQTNGDFEHGHDYWSSEYAWNDIPFQGGYYYSICDSCGRTGLGMAVNGSMLPTRAFYQGEWLPLQEGHRYSFSYWAKSHSTANPAVLAIMVNDQHREWLLPETDTIASAEWTRYEHIFTAQRTNNTLMRIFDFNTSSTGNEFYLDDVSLIDLAEAADAHRDTVRIRNIHGLHFSYVDTTINEGDSYNGYTMAGVYNDTLQLTDYDSITRYRISYVLNTTGVGVTSLSTNTEGLWMDIDAGDLLSNDSISVSPMQTRTIGLAKPTGDNLVANGDFSVLDTLTFDYHSMMYLPQPYSLFDWELLGDRGAYRITDGYLELVYTRDYDSIMSTTFNVEPNTLYEVSFKLRTNGEGFLEEVYIDNEKIGSDYNHQYNSQDANITFDEVPARKYYFNSGDRSQVTLTLMEKHQVCCVYMTIDDLAVHPCEMLDTITVTNRHQIVYTTVDTTINEGESYNGYTLAGLYQETIMGADADTIIRSLVSMNVNRSVDNCMVQLSDLQVGIYVADDQAYYGDNMEVQVLPGESKRLACAPYIWGSNLVVNGDFEQDNSYPYVGDYATDDGDGYGSRTYGFLEGNGVDGSRCMWVGGSSLPDQALFRINIPTMVGHVYRFSYSVLATIYSLPYFAVKVNGQQIDNNDIVPQENEWITFSHDIVATSGNILVELVDLNTEWNGNDFLIDNLSLICLSTSTTDTITITNTHGLVYDTVDVTITEGESYHGHTLAGVYQDTVFGVQTDSIVYSRVSMNINHPFGTGMASLSTNFEGRVWMGLDDDAIGTQPTLTVKVNPSEERRYVLTLLDNDINMQPNGDFELGPYQYFGTEYGWGDIPFQESHYFTICDTCGRSGKGMAIKGSQYMNRYIYDSYTVNLIGGHCYSFSYWAKSRPTNPAVLAIAINDQQQEWRMSETDSLSEVVGEWKRFEHVFTPLRTAPTIFRLIDLNTSAEGNEFFLDDVSIVDLTIADEAYRDTITVRNTHRLLRDTIDVSINEGESYNGHTHAGFYNDTIILADYDSIVYSRVSYVLNTTGEGHATISGNTEDILVDIDNCVFYNGDSLSVQPTEVRHFGHLAQILDTNLVANGNFDQGNVDFVSDYIYRPLPYSLDDSTMDIGGYRIAQSGNNSYFLALYNHGNNGPAYTTTVSVKPNSWYVLSFKAVSAACFPGLDNVGPVFRVDIDGREVSVDRFVCSNNNESYLLANCEYIVSSDNHYHIVRSNDTVMTISLRLDNADHWGWYYYAYDDICLNPLNVIDTITITNRHQIVRAILDTTINEGENYNGYSTAGVYIDTLFFNDYDSITTSRVSMAINSFDGAVQLMSNVSGGWIEMMNNTMHDGQTLSTVVPPMTSSSYIFGSSMGINLIANGDFETGVADFNTMYVTNVDMNGRFVIAPGIGVDSSYGLYMDGATEYGLSFYITNLNLIPGHTYELSYQMKPVNGNPPTIQTSIGNNTFVDYLSGNEVWQLFTHTFVATNSNMTLAMLDLSTEYWGNDFYLDNINLRDISIELFADTITITNRHQLVYDTILADICQGGVYTVDSVGYSNAGTYTLNTRYYNDSTVYPTLILGVHNNYYSQFVDEICEGESYAFGGNTLVATGVYVDSLNTIWGCDSTRTLNLTVHANTASQQIENVCDIYSWHGTSYTASTIVMDTLVNAHGCDSICTLNLTVRHSNTGDTAATACDSFSWHGQTFTSSGTSTYMLTNSEGCDSTLTLTLTVNYSNAGNENFIVCDSMIWHNKLYTTSVVDMDTLVNAALCDSVVTLTLTVNSSYHNSDAVFACDNQLPFIYEDSLLSTSGEHQVVLHSVEGCDSTITVTLTVGNTYNDADTLTLCQSSMPYNYGTLTFYDFDTTGLYIIPFNTVEGCDSIVNLSLTVNESEVTEIYAVTVEEAKNRVVWNKNAAVDHYNIYRESETTGQYDLVAELPFSDEPDWIDTNSDANTRSYRYRMSSVDSCGNESELGNIHKTMYLTINKGQNNSWNLVWTEYEGAYYSTYRIYRGTTYDNLQMIDEVQAVGNTTFTDNNAPYGNLYYMIEILLTSIGEKDDPVNGVVHSNIAANDQTSLESVANDGLIVYQKNGGIVVKSSIGQDIKVYDELGRLLDNVKSTGNDYFNVPASGVYLVRVNEVIVRRVVVVK